MAHKLEPFKFVDLLPDPAEIGPDLSPTEQQILRDFAKPGGPIYKVMRSFVDYMKSLDLEISSTLVASPEAIARVRDLQVMRGMIKWQVDQWERVLTMVRTEEPSE